MAGIFKPEAPLSSKSRIPMVSEREFENQVVVWAKTFGWQVHAERPGQFRDGRWATMIHGHIGFPDVVLARSPRVIFAELKVGRNKASVYQDAWLAALTGTPGVEVYTWRPEQWSSILAVLSKP